MVENKIAYPRRLSYKPPLASYIVDGDFGTRNASHFQQKHFNEIEDDLMVRRMIIDCYLLIMNRCQL